MSLRTRFFCIVLCLFTPIAAASASGQTTDPALAAELAKIDSAAATVTDLSGRFTQRKFTSLLKNPLESSGTVRTSGAIARWDTEQPEPCVLYADRNQFKLYYPDQKLEEVYPLDNQMGEMTSSPLPRLKTIAAHFAIQRASAGDLPEDLKQAQAVRAAKGEPTVALILKPTDKTLAEHVANVTVLLDVATGLTLAVQTADPDGDRTVIVFSDLHPNTGITPADLDLKIPTDATISHPLDAAGDPPPENTPH